MTNYTSKYTHKRIRKKGVQAKSCTLIFTVVIFTIAKSEKKLRCSSVGECIHKAKHDAFVQ